MLKRMSKLEQVLQALTWTLEYIDALPSDVIAELPAMPGFDRDYVDELIYEVKENFNP
jgi:hypothetical protein